MKVFISWSGSKSHKVALVFRDWLPSVIQSIVPYVSSEDIDKGARWSTDIAKELEDSKFGVLCVTKENLDAPWLSFEAGALSKAMDKSFVSPFLFNLKRSEVKGPILQFQSTIFQKDDIKKLVATLNKACGDAGIADARLDEAFDVWYPPLETKLNAIKDVEDEPDEPAVADNKPQSSEILEEILDLSRNNQKLLRNPDTKLFEKVEEVGKLMQEQLINFDRDSDIDRRRMARKFHPMFMEEFLHFGSKESKYHFNFLIALSFFKGDFPWIYDIGKELITVLKSRTSKDAKREAVDEFRMMIDFTFGHPMMREMFGGRKDTMMFMKEMPHFLMKYMDRMAHEQYHLDQE